MDWIDLAVHLVVWGCVLASLVCLVVAAWSFCWPSVMGNVEVSLLDPSLQGEDVHESHVLAYAYEVNGSKYLGSNVKPWGNCDWSVGYGSDPEWGYRGRTFWSRARDLSKWYRPGATVHVYYCPFRPQWSCVEPGGFLFPLMFGGLSAFFYFLLLR